MIIPRIFISCIRALNSLKLLEKRIDTFTLPAPLPSICSIGLLDGFPYCCTGEFIKFSIHSTRAGTLLSYTTSTATDPKSKVYIVVLLLNFGGILQRKWVPLWNMRNYKKTKRCVDFHKDGSHRACQIYVSIGGFFNGIHQNIQKERRLVNAWTFQEMIVFLN